MAATETYASQGFERVRFPRRAGTTLGPSSTPGLVSASGRAVVLLNEGGVRTPLSSSRARLRAAAAVSACSTMCFRALVAGVRFSSKKRATSSSLALGTAASSAAASSAAVA